MDRYEQRIIKIDPVVRNPLTQRITLAVIDAAYKGELDPILSKRIIEYVDTPYAYYYGEPAYTLYDRFIVDTAQLYTASGIRHMLNIVKMAGGYTSIEHYGCLAPKGVRYGKVKIKDAMSILTQGPLYNEQLELAGWYAIEQNDFSEDYYWEEHENYRKVAI